ncbi:MAG: thiamine-phosphate synthase family protein [Dehalococcoidia bacterium]|nr:thiamine-phosphate synthase family protein [Dehalococcoidia bacterium]
MRRKDAAERIMGNLCLAVERLQRCREFSLLMPEVRVNVVYALPGAKDPAEVAAIDGRITVVNGYPLASGLPRWGGSDHMARLIIEARKYSPDINAGINFKCDESIIKVVKKYAREKRLLFGWIDRAAEPDQVSKADGRSMPWKIKQLVSGGGRMPDIFYEGDGWGKEPLFVGLGSDATGVVRMAIEIARRYTRSRKR